MPHIETDAAVQRKFVVVVWVGAPAQPAVLDRLQQAGIGTMVAPDASRASALLSHFRPSALLSSSLDELLSVGGPTPPLVLVGALPGDGRVPTHVRRVAHPTPDAIGTAIHAREADEPTTTAA